MVLFWCSVNKGWLTSGGGLVGDLVLGLVGIWEGPGKAVELWHGSSRGLVGSAGARKAGRFLVRSGKESGS